MEFLNSKVNKDNLMLLDIVYHAPRKENDRIDALDIVYKDIDTGEKHLKTIEEPDIEIYFTKDQYRDYTYTKSFTELDKCEKHTCKYKTLPWYIAKQAGDNYVNELKRMVESGRYRDIQKIHSYPYVFGSDLPIDMFYRVNWLLEYDNNGNRPLTKTYLDIEVDTINFSGFAKNGECPINAVTIIDEETNSVHTFLLNNPDNPLIKELMDDIDGLIDELHTMFDEFYGVLDYRIYMYDDERDLIIDLFRLINTLKRDICLIWNMSFDIPYIIARAERLHLNPEDFMCHRDFKFKTCKFVHDTRNFDIANKGDCFKLSSYTKFIDQMILYAATRKGQSELRSHALNYVAQSELGDEKLDYSDEANIKTLPYKNYRKFVIYNIKDTLLQMGIEKKVNDVDGLYMRSYSNCVEMDKTFRQTVMLKGRAYYEYLLQGNILGNNINVINRDNKGGFTGAVVGNPLLNSNTGINLFGLQSMFVFDNVIDMDFSSMYPHIIIAFNIERNTMIGKLLIEGFNKDRYSHKFNYDAAIDVEFEDIDDDTEDIDSTYDAGKDFMDNYLTGDVLTIGSKWFNLPSFDEINKEFRKEFKIKKKKRSFMKKIEYFIDELKI